MALINTQQCYKCGKETPHLNGKCSICANKECKHAYEVYLAAKDSLCVVDRLRLVEDWIYNHKDVLRFLW